MASVNKVIIVGNLGKDPEIRTFPDGATVCNITVATSRRWKPRDGGDWQEETEWHRVVFRDRLAEVAAEYLRKGRPVYVEGRLKTRKWTDKEGKDNYTTEIIATEMQMLGGREGMGGGAGSKTRFGQTASTSSPRFTHTPSVATHAGRPATVPGPMRCCGGCAAGSRRRRASRSWSLAG